MSISSDFIKIIEEIPIHFKFPPIKEIITPQGNDNSKKENFSAIILDDNTVGLIFTNLNPVVKEKFRNREFTQYENLEIIELVKLFKSNDLFEKSLALGCINAISQFIFRNGNFRFDFTTDSLGLLNIKSTDIIGMVGFFPPLVKLIEKIGSKLIIIEKKEELVQTTDHWSVTLDPSKLRKCNKVLITGTTVLNETLEEILLNCTNADKASVIGPTTSFLPDPLFERGIDVIGGSYVVDSRSLKNAIEKNLRWGDSVRKYTIEKKNYVGYRDLLSRFIN
ncbi:MAG: Rossmann-like domain-containing protein [Candidatus Hermodarchaeota archaeon]